MASPDLLSTLYLVGLTLTLTLALVSSAVANSTAEEYVDAHNAVRAEVGVEPLTWNATLAAYAQDYANTRIEKCEFEHSQGPYGENLAMGFEEMTAEQAMKLWADEKKFYDHSTYKCAGGECLHYTQVVWRNTKSVGCSSVKCKNNWVFLICNYFPPGNYIGQPPY